MKQSVRALRMAGILAGLWLIFFTLWRQLPYVRSGAAVVHGAKETQEWQGRIFPASVPLADRLIVFGDSKVLSGFIPSAFDAQVGGAVYSTNMGKPEDARFAGDLENLARIHQLPRYVLITMPWALEEPPRDDVFHFLQNDSRVMDRLFPFRKFPRDLTLFGLASLGRGGLRALYRRGETAVRQMEDDRGWYFIEGQSHYAGDRLPDDFRLATDRPDAVEDRAFFPRGPEFHSLNTFAQNLGTRFYIVPGYHRSGELAPSPERAAMVATRMSSFPGFTVAGPEYFLFPSRYFSDPIHLNPEGARLYTRKLAEIMRPIL